MFQDNDIRAELEDRINELKQQMDSPIKVEDIKPTANQGSQGSKKIVKEGQQVYHNIENDPVSMSQGASNTSESFQGCSRVRCWLHSTPEPSFCN